MRVSAPGSAAVTPAGSAGATKVGSTDGAPAFAGQHVIHGIRGRGGKGAHIREPRAQDIVAPLRVVHAGGDVPGDHAERRAVDGQLVGKVIEPVGLVSDAAGVVVGAFHFGFGFGLSLKIGGGGLPGRGAAVPRPGVPCAGIPVHGSRVRGLHFPVTAPAPCVPGCRVRRAGWPFRKPGCPMRGRGSPLGQPGCPLAGAGRPPGPRNEHPAAPMEHPGGKAGVHGSAMGHPAAANGHPGTPMEHPGAAGGGIGTAKTATFGPKPRLER